MRIAFCTRRSSDLQNNRSTADQLDALRIVAAARGGIEVAVFTDEGISGANLANRPGVQAMLAAVRVARSTRS